MAMLFSLTTIIAFALSTVFASPAFRLSSDIARPNAILLHPVLDTTKCLDVRGNVLANGTAVQLFECNGTPAQDWIHTETSLTSNMRLNGIDFCLDAGSDPANGVGMKIWTCFEGIPAQLWQTNFTRISLYNQGFCLDVTDGNTADGTQVQTWECTDNDTNQDWTTLPTKA